MNTQRFAVEFDRRTVGIAVRVPGGFAFYAAGDGLFAEMDGHTFPRARAIERQLRRVSKRRRNLSRQPSPALGRFSQIKE